ncbi:UvrD-helicase domain-containing protein [Priestia megaterium]
MKKILPTHEQETILNWNDNAVIIAGPGSGKTWTLAKKIEQILPYCKYYQGIIAISYTNKASKELENRAKNFCKETKASFFGTIDGFCSREIVLSFGKHFMGVPNKKIIIEKTFDTEKIEKIKDIKKEITDLIEKYSSININILNKDGTSPYYYLSEESQEYLEGNFKNGNVDLNLLAPLAYLIFISSIPCQQYMKAKYKFLFIDEFQDSSLEQYNLFKRLVELGIKGWVVGDLNQSIYSFKSGNPQYMKDLIKVYKFKDFSMKINHRCHPYIQLYAKAFLDIQSTKTHTSFSNKNSRIIRVSIDGNQYNIGEWINNKIESLLSYTKTKYRSDIIILARNHNTLNIISQALRIPYRFHRKIQLDSDGSLGGNMLRQLLMIAFNPANYTILDFIEIHFNKSIPGSMNNIKKVKLLVELFINKCRDNDRWSSKKNTLLSDFNNLVQEIYPEYTLNNNTILAFEELINSPVFLDVFKPTNSNEIQLMTIHGAKGLEFNVVLHLDLYEDEFPSYASKDNLIKQQEDVNLHYIALTRAKNHVFLLTSSRKQIFSKKYMKVYENPKQPSPYITGEIERYQQIVKK